MVSYTLKSVNNRVPVKKVTASQGKMVRAEPISSYYEQGKIHHVCKFAELEDQLCSYSPDSTYSPDRMDALVWAMTELMSHKRPANIVREDRAKITWHHREDDRLFYVDPNWRFGVE